MSTPIKTFGDLAKSAFQEAKTRRNLTKTALARRASISTNHLTRILNGKTVPNVHLAGRLARILNIPPQQYAETVMAHGKTVENQLGDLRTLLSAETMQELESQLVDFLGRLKQQLASTDNTPNKTCELHLTATITGSEVQVSGDTRRTEEEEQ